jgi:hypothetical protein
VSSRERGATHASEWTWGPLKGDVEVLGRAHLSYEGPTQSKLLRFK